MSGDGAEAAIASLNLKVRPGIRGPGSVRVGITVQKVEHRSVTPMEATYQDGRYARRPKPWSFRSVANRLRHDRSLKPPRRGPTACVLGPLDPESTLLRLFKRLGGQRVVRSAQPLDRP
jgi:hypothetical protein